MDRPPLSGRTDAEALREGFLVELEAEEAEKGEEAGEVARARGGGARGQGGAG